MWGRVRLALLLVLAPQKTRHDPVSDRDDRPAR